MDKWIYALDMVMSYGVSGYVLFKFMSGLFKPKYEKKRYVVAYLTFVTLAIFFNWLGIAILKSLYGILSIVFIGTTLFKSNSKGKVFGACVLFFLYMVIIDALSVLTFAVFTNNTIESVRENPLLLLTAGTGNQIILLCFYKPLLTVMKKHKFDAVSIQQNLFLGILALFEVMQLIFTMSIVEGIFNRTILTILNLGFLGLDIYLIYIFEAISQKYALEKEVELRDQQMAMQNNYYHVIETQYDRSRRLIHDMRNHMQTLEELYSIGNTKEADDYAKTILSSMDRMGSRFKCTNRVLNIIMNDKILKCDEKNIKLETEIEDIDLDFIEPFDITTIFSNLLDNAIEACETLEDSQKIISIKLYHYKNFIVVKISNRFGELLIWDNNKNLISTKSGNHMGLGLKNVKFTVEKYDGNIEFKKNKDNFEAKVLFSL